MDSRTDLSTRPASQQDDSLADKLGREAYVLGLGTLEGFGNKAVETFHDPREFAGQAGLSFALGVGLTLAQRSPTPLRLAAQVGAVALGAAFIKDVAGQLGTIGHVASDTWRSGENSEANKELIGDSLGAFMFDMTTMGIAGGLGVGAARSRGFNTRIREPLLDFGHRFRETSNMLGQSSFGMQPALAMASPSYTSRIPIGLERPQLMEARAMGGGSDGFFSRLRGNKQEAALESTVAESAGLPQVRNPYLEEFTRLQDNRAYSWAIDTLEADRLRGGVSQADYTRAYKIHKQRREELTHKYAWAIPNQQALETIAAHGPILEAGAGTGYWAGRLREMGVDVLAFDRYANNLQANGYHNGARHLWTDVVTGTESLVAQNPGRTLFMSFPPPDSPFAFNALKSYKGDRFVFVGERPYPGEFKSITGDESFHRLLASEWRPVETVELPNWRMADGRMRDELVVYERGRAS